MTDAAPAIGTLMTMAKQSKKPADLNRLAAAIVGDATDEDQHEDSSHVVAGRLGGERGGRVRAERLTAEQRSEAARRAAEARWGKKDA